MANSEFEGNLKVTQAVSTHEVYEAQEKERVAKYDKMIEIGDSLGPRTFFVAPNHIGFDEWQEALNFQDLCAEQGFKVHVVNPPRNSSSLGNYFKVYPE